MDINNIQALIAQGLITDVASVDPNKAYVAVGVFQPGNRPAGSGNANAYPSYAIPISEFLAAGGIYTASNGITLVGNDFQLASNLISQFTNDSGYLTSSSITGMVTGSGTLNYIPKWTPSGNVLGNSLLFDNGTNVGLNTNTPSSTLDIISNNSNPSTNMFKVSSSVFTNGMTYVDGIGNLTVRGSDGSYTNITSYHALNDAYVTINGTTNSILQITRAGANRFAITATNTNDVRHNHYVNTIHSLYSNSRVITDTSKEVMYHEHTSGYTGFGTLSPSAQLHIKGIDSTLANYALKVDNSASSPLLYVRNDGNVGIGIIPTIADAKLEIKVATNQRLLFINSTYGVGSALTLHGVNDALSDVVNVVTLGLDWYHASRNNLFADGSNLFTPSAKVHIVGRNQGSDLFALKVDNVVSNPLLYVRNDGVVAMSLLPTSNAGLSTGELYVDTAANILANGDKVVGWKV